MKRAWVVLFLLVGCTERKAESIPRATPKPLEPLVRVTVDAGDERDALHEVVPFNPVGPALPEGAANVALAGEKTAIPAGEGAVLLVPDEDTFVAQLGATFAALDDARREVWLKHPDAAIAFKVKLRDAPSFQAWIDEPVPGKVRVIQRGDGFELQTNLGKLPGDDPNGPTVPVRGGKMDLTTLQKGFGLVQAKFKAAPDVCFVPSYGMELAKVARAMAVNYAAADSAYFNELCLVYPRPTKEAATDAGH